MQVEWAFGEQFSLSAELQTRASRGEASVRQGVRRGVAVSQQGGRAAAARVQSRALLPLALAHDALRGAAPELVEWLNG